MRVLASLKGAVAIASCIAVLVLTALWNEYPPHVREPVASDAAPYGVTDQVRIPSKTEAVSKIAIYLVSLAGVAAYVSTTVQRRKILIGAAASTTCALLAITVVEAILASAYDVTWVPRADATILIVCTASLLLGAGASWVAQWRPNKSFERTREG
jgi:hypothetical protein